MRGSRNIHNPKGRSFEIQSVEGVSMVVVFKGMSKAKLEILEGWGGGSNQSSVGRGMGIFWNNHMYKNPF